MISFIKKLFGIGSTETAPTAAPYKIEPKTTTTAIDPATPVIKAETPAASTAPAKRNRRPRNRNKTKVSSNIVDITEGKTKGSTSAVKTHHTPAKVAPVKSTKPKHPAKAK